ncbi:hypothetical protein BDW02DRAFT_44472 [Decorospora gaudefroyi]|uniref:Uncharacterized protein n=1 Tax=Decorospora gaudefroyi TaxID=184978 RepID=A0A6A5KA34_9PLEO|nr:hypothetical protein BDW02DRAFT_44472 [Decorospora gaudefroyi]
MKLHDLYADLMKVYPFGLGLYKPPSTLALRPGSVGYFNELGVWQPIVQLENAEDVKGKGLKIPEEELAKHEFDPETDWAPMYSTEVIEADIASKIKAGASTGTVSLEGKLFLEFHSSSNSGAVMMTAKPVSHRAYYYESPFSRWVADNLDALTTGPRREEIKKYGLSIITDTYSSKKCILNAWQGQKKTVSIGLSVNPKGVIDMGLEGGWHIETAAGGWKEYTGKTPEEEVVVFCSGLHFSIRRILGFNLVSMDSLQSRAGAETDTELAASVIASKIEKNVAFEVMTESIGLGPVKPKTQPANDDDDDDDDDGNHDDNEENGED